MFQIFNLKFVIRKNKNNLEQINVQKTRTAYQRIIIQMNHLYKCCIQLKLFTENQEKHINKPLKTQEAFQI